MPSSVSFVHDLSSISSDRSHSGGAKPIKQITSAKFCRECFSAYKQAINPPDGTSKHAAHAEHFHQRNFNLNQSLKSNNKTPYNNLMSRLII